MSYLFSGKYLLQWKSPQNTGRWLIGKKNMNNQRRRLFNINQEILSLTSGLFFFCFFNFNLEA